MAERRCSKCGGPADRPGQRYCRDCHNAYKRAWTPNHAVTPEERRKQNARAYSKVLLKRAVLDRKPCVHCGAEPAEMHHPDYAKPRLVVWMCRDCHRQLHRLRKLVDRLAGR